ncbi:peptide-methionine (R)-S-oxide reductase MsrB [Leucobacter sp. 1207-22]|uniref:peptide-methionine (R)-S-oxide reductase MsrB n=1 Tax=Leucobacter sp. 1207-22 TaxID=2604456 RepID=UPI0040643D3E
MSKPIESADYPLQRSSDEWRNLLSPTEFDVLRKGGTERAWTGELLDEERAGLYTCRACGNELFLAGTKFDSGCGWPSFYESIREGAVELLEDRSLGMVRTEVRCANCGSHLGHVFPDGFGTPTGDRYCMNSVSLAFTPEAE